MWSAHVAHTQTAHAQHGTSLSPAARKARAVLHGKPTGDTRASRAVPGQAWSAKEHNDARHLSVHTVWDRLASQKGRVQWAWLGRPGLRLQPLSVRLAAWRVVIWGGRRSAARQGP